MTSEQFTDELGQILGAPKGTSILEARLADYPGWDSMGKMAAMTLIDTDVGVPVPAGLVEQWKTVGEIVDFVRPHLKAQ